MIMSDQAARLRELVRKVKGNSPVQGKERRAVVFCITSGKGGVGKTSFTVNFAIALSRCDKKVVIIDADFGFSNVNVLLGTNTKYNISHVLKGQKRLNEIMEECHTNVWHISGGAGLLDLLNIDDEKLENVVTQLEELEKVVDYILIDTGAGFNNNILRMISASDRTVLIMTSEPTSILDSYVVLKAISVLKERPQLFALINKADSEKDAMKTFESFSQVVQKHLGYGVDMLGYIPTDNRMTESILSLVPYTIQYPSRPLSIKMQLIANSVANLRPDERQRGIKGFFNSLFD